MRVDGVSLFAALVLAGAFWSCGGSAQSKAKISVGAPAPDVSGIDQNGEKQSLVASRGRFAVVYFYPKDDTPGCTKEACAFRDVWDRFKSADVYLFGVSKGDMASHKAFAQKHKLPFPLIADKNGVWGSAFGVSSMMGMYKRVTFLVDPAGKIAKIYDDVDPGVHATQILSDLESLSAK